MVLHNLKSRDKILHSLPWNISSGHIYHPWATGQVLSYRTQQHVLVTGTPENGPDLSLGAAITELRISQGSVHMIDLLGDHSTGVPLQWTDVQG